MTHRAVFLDKDGTLIENVPYNVDPNLIRLVPSAGPALRLLCERGYTFFVITNQTGIAKGLFDEHALQSVQKRINILLAEYDVSLQGFYYCPHSPYGVVKAYTQHCECHKPLPGLLYQAARQHSIDLDKSWMIGDILHDVEAGRRAGCRTVLIDNGNETQWELSDWRLPHFTVTDLYMAATAIAQADGYAH